MISVRDLTKRYGDTTAVAGISFDVQPGRVTGFLGPNGAGKSTTMRMILGLDAPTSGVAVVGGRPYRDLPRPLCEVGALLDTKASHPRRSAYHHLLAMARSNGIASRRVDDVLDMVGLGDVAHKKTGEFSLGMGQRLGIAGALLGDPGIVMFDEPVNGLDPDGVLWVRRFMRSLADEGRTVFVSSHLMSEMQLTADHVVVIGRGQVIADEPVADVIESKTAGAVHVRVPDPSDLEQLRNALNDSGADARPSDDGVVVSASTVEQVGDLAHALGIRLHGLQPQQASLEEAYMELTASSLDYTTGDRP